MKPASLLAPLVFSLSASALVMACGGATETVGDPQRSGETSSGGASGGPSSGASGDSTSAGTSACCPPDKQQSGSMFLGGAATGGACHRTHDFWCSENWRIENDASGCPVWRYDMRAPAADETATCQPAPITCTPGAYVFCRCADGAEGTKQCQSDGKRFDACLCG